VISVSTLYMKHIIHTHVKYSEVWPLGPHRAKYLQIPLQYQSKFTKFLSLFLLKSTICETIRFSKWCCRKFKHFEILYHLNYYIAGEYFKDRSSFIFIYYPAGPWRWRDYHRSKHSKAFYKRRFVTSKKIWITKYEINFRVP
jgi:hypothetical protein